MTHQEWTKHGAPTIKTARLPRTTAWSGHRPDEPAHLFREVSVAVELEFLHAEKAKLRCTVRDTGVGIPPEKYETIFESFSQADMSITRQYGGTGLGLAISRQLVHLMGGEIAVESQVNQGSTFSFTLPFDVSTQSDENELLERTANVPRALPPLRVLLVEDNLINQRLAVALLKKWSHEVHVANNGQEALAILETLPFDVVLMDLQMPVMGGLEATTRIREREQGTSRRIPILAITANAMGSDREECMRVGMDDFVSKPIQRETLHAALQKACSGVGPFVGVAPRVETPPAAFDAAQALTCVDQEVLGMFGPLFLEHHADLMAAIRAALEGQDAYAMSRGAHSLKGTLGYLGAKPAEELSLKLETLGKEGSMHGAPALFAELEAQIDQVVQALRSHLQNGTFAGSENAGA